MINDEHTQEAADMQAAMEAHGINADLRPTTRWTGRVWTDAEGRRFYQVRSRTAISDEFCYVWISWSNDLDRPSCGPVVVYGQHPELMGHNAA